MSPRELWRLTRHALNAWVEDYASSMGAALSYYTLFSITPLLVIVIAVAGFFFGAEAVRGEVFSQLAGLVGDQGARAIEQTLQRAGTQQEGSIAAAVSFFVLLIGATTVLGELRTDLDRIWCAPESAKPSGLWGFVRSRFLSILLILGIAFVLMVSLVASAILAALGKWWGSWF